MFGVWKRRFPVLAYGLRLKLETSLTVIVAAGVLYNYAKLNNEPEPPPAEGIDPHDLDRYILDGQIPAVAPANAAQNQANGDVRNDYINYFANL